ncbi:hypothetical protein D9615_009035 [Tricholomella constricta]|uniref:Reverse transcriptase Ty1/copia-type domain-containing protein n=1 Tax=Tricholomella constricta TaxID=117010 RepID=A0A8H5H0M0_9AGAR|nr:hypothetical protein D9615_009035 [Tricholomella constricta]
MRAAEGVKVDSGHEEEDMEDTKGIVALVDKAIYGTMDGAHNWWKTLDAEMTQLGYVKSRADQSVRWRKQEEEITVTCTYTDDVIGISSTADGAATARKEFGEKYEVKDLGDIEMVLGIRVKRDRTKRELTLDQEEYLKRVLERHNMSCLFLLHLLFVLLMSSFNLDIAAPASVDPSTILRDSELAQLSVEDRARVAFLGVPRPVSPTSSLPGIVTLVDGSVGAVPESSPAPPSIPDHRLVIRLPVRSRQIRRPRSSTPEVEFEPASDPVSRPAATSLSWGSLLTDELLAEILRTAVRVPPSLAWCETHAPCDRCRERRLSCRFQEVRLRGTLPCVDCRAAHSLCSLSLEHGLEVAARQLGIPLAWLRSRAEGFAFSRTGVAMSFTSIRRALRLPLPPPLPVVSTSPEGSGVVPPPRAPPPRAFFRGTRGQGRKSVPVGRRGARLSVQEVRSSPIPGPSPSSSRNSSVSLVPVRRSGPIVRTESPDSPIAGPSEPLFLKGSSSSGSSSPVLPSSPPAMLISTPPAAPVPSPPSSEEYLRLQRLYDQEVARAQALSVQVELLRVEGQRAKSHLRGVLADFTDERERFLHLQAQTSEVVDVDRDAEVEDLRMEVSVLQDEVAGLQGHVVHLQEVRDHWRGHALDLRTRVDALDLARTAFASDMYIADGALRRALVELEASPVRSIIDGAHKILERHSLLELFRPPSIPSRRSPRSSISLLFIALLLLAKDIASMRPLEIGLVGEVGGDREGGSSSSAGPSKRHRIE